MFTVRRVLVGVAALLVPMSVAMAQAPPQPGPEHKKLKEMEGTWDAVIKMGGSESKGSMVWKMDLGGLWLVSDFQGEFQGQKFSGKGMDSYDPNSKKYVGIWVDSMSTTPMTSEGNYDKDGKKLTMTGEGPGPDGKPTKYKNVTEHVSKDKIVFTMYIGGQDGKDAEMFSITYTRRK